MLNKISSFQAAKFSVPLQFNEKELPYTLYEVNASWRNRSEGKTEKRCFLYSSANDTENDYRRYIRVFDECEKSLMQLVS